MKEQSSKILKLASTSIFPRSSLYAGLIIEKYNEGKPIATINYPKQSENTFACYIKFLELQKAHRELNQPKKQLSRKGKRGWRRNRHFVKLQKAKIRQIKIN